MIIGDSVAATFDVNVLVSVLLGPSGTPHHTVQAWRDGQVRHITSEHIIATLAAKIAARDLGRRFPFISYTGDTLLTEMREKCVIINLPAEAVVPVTGDPEDDAVIATAVEGHAEYLVTGDRALLALGVHRGVRMVTPRDFVQLLQA